MKYNIVYIQLKLHNQIKMYNTTILYDLQNRIENTEASTDILESTTGNKSFFSFAYILCPYGARECSSEFTCFGQIPQQHEASPVLFCMRFYGSAYCSSYGYKVWGYSLWKAWCFAAAAQQAQTDIGTSGGSVIRVAH